MKNSKIFFGFALADSMFANMESGTNIRRNTLTAEEVKRMAEAGELTPCLNPSHQATIDAMRKRYGIEMEIPETPPRVSVGHGDSVVVMGVRGLPRLTDRHEYTEEEIASASFQFSMYTVEPKAAPMRRTYTVANAGTSLEKRVPVGDYCPHCGKSPTEGFFADGQPDAWAVYAPWCESSPRVRFCPNCGGRISPEMPVEN